jgi:hypothetical protein
MKKFTFPLSRVLDWRAIQARTEESKLEVLYAELRGIDAQETLLVQELAASEQAVLRAGAATGAELAALDGFRRHVAARHTRLEQQRAECSQRVAAQIQIVVVRRRDVRLLDRLKQQRLNAWNQQLSREIDLQADEAYLARWKAPEKRL